jgi:hypothetical protein
LSRGNASLFYFYPERISLLPLKRVALTRFFLLQFSKTQQLFSFFIDILDIIEKNALWEKEAGGSAIQEFSAT